MSAETRTIPKDRPFEIWLWHSRHITPEQLDRWPETAQRIVAEHYIQYLGLRRANLRTFDLEGNEAVSRMERHGHQAEHILSECAAQRSKAARATEDTDRAAFVRAARAAQQAEARAALDEVTLPRWMAWLIGMAFFVLIAFGGARLLAWIASR